MGSLRQIQFSSSHRQPGPQSFLQPRLMSSRHTRDMLQGAFTSLCSTYSLCSFSPIVSIFQIVLTTVSSSIPLEYSACRSVLSSSNGFLVSSSDVSRALTCSMSRLYCRNLFVVSHRTFTTKSCLAVNVLSNYVRVLDNSSHATIQRVHAQ